MSANIMGPSPCTLHENDFYLCSHATIKGIARPMHYYVLLAEAKMSNEETRRSKLWSTSNAIISCVQRAPGTRKCTTPTSPPIVPFPLIRTRFTLRARPQLWSLLRRIQAHTTAAVYRSLMNRTVPTVPVHQKTSKSQCLCLTCVVLSARCGTSKFSLAHTYAPTRPIILDIVSSNTDLDGSCVIALHTSKFVCVLSTVANNMTEVNLVMKIV